MYPRVSVNIPVYNGASFIKEAIDSVLAQTYGNIEIVILNDGSTDESANIIKGYGDKVRYYEQSNQGLARTRNKMVFLSTGEYIAFIDQDDVWVPDKIEKQLDLFELDPDIALVFSDCEVISGDGETLHHTLFGDRKPNSDHIFEEMIAQNCIPLPTVIMKKSVFGNVGNYVENYGIAEEYDLFLKVAKYYKVEYCDEVLAKYRVHANNTSKNIKRAIEETLTIHKYWRDQYGGNGDELSNILDDAQKKLLIRYIVYMRRNVGFLNMMKAISKIHKLGISGNNKIKRDVLKNLIWKAISHIWANGAEKDH